MNSFVDYRQEASVATRSHEEGQLGQALEPSLCCPGLLYPELATTSKSESESEGVEDALLSHIKSVPLCRVMWDYVPSFNKLCVMCVRAGRQTT